MHLPLALSLFLSPFFSHSHYIPLFLSSSSLPHPSTSFLFHSSRFLAVHAPRTRLSDRDALTKIPFRPPRYYVRGFNGPFVIVNWVVKFSLVSSGSRKIQPFPVRVEGKIQVFPRIYRNFNGRPSVLSGINGRACSTVSLEETHPGSWR